MTEHAFSGHDRFPGTDGFPGTAGGQGFASAGGQAAQGWVAKAAASAWTIRSPEQDLLEELARRRDTARRLGDAKDADFLAEVHDLAAGYLSGEVASGEGPQLHGLQVGEGQA